WGLSAEVVVDRLRRGEVSPDEVLDALAERIAAVDAEVNALPTLCCERARKHARALADVPARAGLPLAGLPVPIKDAYEVAGVSTPWGSRIHADHISTRSDYLVEAIEAAGGIVYAKSNTPEF